MFTRLDAGYRREPMTTGLHATQCQNNGEPISFPSSPSPASLFPACSTQVQNSTTRYQIGQSSLYQHATVLIPFRYSLAFSSKPRYPQQHQPPAPSYLAAPFLQRPPPPGRPFSRLFDCLPTGKCPEKGGNAVIFFFEHLEAEIAS